MKVVTYQAIVHAVTKLAQEANYFLGSDVVAALSKAVDIEESPSGKIILQQILENADIAAKEEEPICQDCGAAVVFLEIGQDLRIEGGYLEDAINQGVSIGYKSGYLRKSMCDSFSRKNTGDNTPAIIHTKIVPGENLKITVAPKGGGSENMSAIRMFPPSAGVSGVKDFIIQQILQAGPNPCPPVIVGIGIGGNFEKAALSAKEALLRDVGKPSDLPEIAALEKELLHEINKLGIGPQGLGGRVTALAVHINYLPCHIASFPVAVNLNCHAARHKTMIL